MDDFPALVGLLSFLSSPNSLSDTIFGFSPSFTTTSAFAILIFSLAKFYRGGVFCLEVLLLLLLVDPVELGD
jgi:hypothetical protein